MLYLEKLGRLELSEFRIKALHVHVYSYFSEMGLSKCIYEWSEKNFIVDRNHYSENKTFYLLQVKL